jgi:nucleoside-diphosphate-sugar epimerase
VLKAGPQLTSVVVTSSTIAVTNPKDEPEYTFTEKDFASAVLELVIKNKEAGVATSSAFLYGASKTASERVVWKFRDSHKVSPLNKRDIRSFNSLKPSFSISTINPSVVFGPPAALAPDPSQLNETLRPIYDIFSGNAKGVSPTIGSGSFVDVRDVALEHVWAYEHPKESDGQRYIACAGKGQFQAAADILRYHYKGTEIGEKIAAGTPGEGYEGYDEKTGAVKDVKYSPGTVRIDGSKAERVMGFKYIPLEQSIVDTAKAFEVYLKSE